MIPRKIEDIIRIRLFKGKAILLFGARQVGKTTLVKNLAKISHKKVLHLNGDEPDIRELLGSISSSQLKNYIGNNELVVIDEAQRIQNIGITLKLITDNYPEIQVIATGSSSLDIANSAKEPLTGRKFEYTLYPFSFQELVNNHGLLEEKRQLEQRLIYGSYPEIVQNPNESEELLNLISDSYLYKDLLLIETIKRPKLLAKLLKALALQIGNEVSYNELSQLVGADKGTVEKYIDLLEQTFVVFTLPSFSRNVRNELKKSKKIYFYDTGIRNSIIGNFNPVHSRTDIGALWENYLIADRIKKAEYGKIRTNFYFWRTTQQQEIDLIEETDGKLAAFEFKWNEKAKAKFPKTFSGNYPGAKFGVITRQNYETFLT
jgi:uncharacterized protein